MSTITRERAAGIANGEKCYTHDDVVELARIAMASLEAEAVAWRCVSTVTVNKPVADDWKRRGFAFHPLYAAPPAPVVPNGWVLVPVEPTHEMQSAAACAIRFDTTPINKLWTGNAVYRAMLAAAPQQEVKQALAKGMERYGDAMQELAKKEVKR